MSRLPPNFVNTDYSKNYSKVKGCLLWVNTPFSYHGFLQIIQIEHRGDVSRLWPRNTKILVESYSDQACDCFAGEKLQSRQILSYHDSWNTNTLHFSALRPFRQVSWDLNLMFTQSTFRSFSSYGSFGDPKRQYCTSYAIHNIIIHHKASSSLKKTAGQVQ